MGGIIVHAKQDVIFPKFAFKPRTEVQSSGFRHTGSGSKSQASRFSEMMVVSLNVSVLPMK